MFLLRDMEYLHNLEVKNKKQRKNLITSILQIIRNIMMFVRTEGLLNFLMLCNFFQKGCSI